MMTMSRCVYDARVGYRSAGGNRTSAHVAIRMPNDSRFQCTRASNCRACTPQEYFVCRQQLARIISRGSRVVEERRARTRHWTGSAPLCFRAGSRATGPRVSSGGQQEKYNWLQPCRCGHRHGYHSDRGQGHCKGSGFFAGRWYCPCTRFEWPISRDQRDSS